MPTALIVGEDPDQAEMAARLLRYRNFDSDIAHTGGAGLSKARSLKPDVVLLDLMLPDTTGFDVCRRLRADPATTHLPVIMVTTLDQPEDRMAALQAGADDFMTKPIHLLTLMARVRRACGWGWP